jgi:hypothetical protein
MAAQLAAEIDFDSDPILSAETEYVPPPAPTPAPTPELVPKASPTAAEPDDTLPPIDPAAPMIDDAPPLAPEITEVTTAASAAFDVKPWLRIAFGWLSKIPMPKIPMPKIPMPKIPMLRIPLPKIPLPRIPMPQIPVPDGLRKATSRYRGMGSRVKPAYVVAALAAIVVVLVYERANIVRMMPQMASLYGKVGTETNLRGLIFDELKAMTEVEDGKAVLVIEGMIRNITSGTVDVPRLRFAVRNATGSDVYSWTALPERNSLKAGEWLRFRTRLASPPPATRDAYVRFFNRNDVAAGSAQQ